MFKVNNKLNLTIKTIERSRWRRLLLTYWTSKCFLGKILIYIVLLMSFYWFDINSEERLYYIIGVLTNLWILMDKNVSSFLKPEVNLIRFSLAISVISFTLMIFLSKKNQNKYCMLNLSLANTKWKSWFFVLTRTTSYVSNWIRQSDLLSAVSSCYQFRK